VKQLLELEIPSLKGEQPPNVHGTKNSNGSGEVTQNMQRDGKHKEGKAHLDEENQLVYLLLQCFQSFQFDDFGRYFGNVSKHSKNDLSNILIRAPSQQVDAEIAGKVEPATNSHTTMKK
jgi:hypothetical protein